MRLGVTVDSAALVAGLRALADRDIRIASVWAVNDMASDIKDDLALRMQVVFDRPTRWTLNAFQVVKARADVPEAVVKLKDGAAQRHYLHVEEEGGPRPQTGLEKHLSRALAHEGVIQSIIPAEHARLDAYGNWSTGERNQVLASLGAHRDGAANETAASRARNKGRARYFMPTSGLAPGVYKRTSKAGAALRVLKFSPKVPVYQQRLGFYERAGDLFAQRMEGHLARTVGQMLRKRFG